MGGVPVLAGSVLVFAVAAQSPLEIDTFVADDDWVDSDTGDRLGTPLEGEIRQESTTSALTSAPGLLCSSLFLRQLLVERSCRSCAVDRRNMRGDKADHRSQHCCVVGETKSGLEQIGLWQEDAEPWH